MKDDLPQFLLDNLREGKKEHRDHYEPFVLRNYKEKPNAVWMSDGHDIEMSCIMPDGSLHCNLQTYGLARPLYKNVGRLTLAK